MTKETEFRGSGLREVSLPFSQYRIEATYNNGGAMAEFIDFESAAKRFAAVLSAYKGPEDEALTHLVLYYNNEIVMIYSRYAITKEGLAICIA